MLKFKEVRFSPKVAQEKSTACKTENFMFFKSPKKSTNIWANFVSKFVSKNSHKSAQSGHTTGRREEFNVT